MGRYQWTNKPVAHVWGLGYQPDWYTETTGVMLGSVESPGGPGDVLHEVQVSYSAAMHASAGLITPDPGQLWCMSTLLIGEVYSVGTGGFPDPSQPTEQGHAIRAFAPVVSVALDPSDDSKGIMTMSTGGVVRSQAKRGPAEYGAGHPEVRIGCWTSNIFDTMFFGATNSSMTLWISALWYVV